jgi:hypothetical protein
MKQQWETNQEEKVNNPDHEFGLSVIPMSSQKTPFRAWAEYQEKITQTNICWFTMSYMIL